MIRTSRREQSIKLEIFEKGKRQILTDGSLQRTIKGQSAKLYLAGLQKPCYLGT